MSLEWRAPVPQLQHATESIYARIYDIKAYPDIRLIPRKYILVETPKLSRDETVRLWDCAYLVRLEAPKINVISTSFKN